MDFVLIDFVEAWELSHTYTHEHEHRHSDMTAFLSDWSIESSVTFRGIGVARPIDQITDL